MRVDLKIDPRVNLADAFQAMGRAVGSIAEGFRRMALPMAEAGVKSARTIPNGRRRHGITKQRRDILRRVRRLEMERKGWK